MTIKKIRTMLICGCLAGVLGFIGCTAMLSGLAKAAGDRMTVTVASLDGLVPTAGIGSNLHPAELGTMSQSFFPGWIPGGDMITVMFTKKAETGYFKLDGSVTINGTPMNYVTLGTYCLYSNLDLSPRKFEITMLSGQKAGFTIEPPKNRLKLVSINGQKDGKIKLDLSKDAVLELEYPAEMENSKMKVSIAITQLGIKEMYDVCYTKTAHKMTIPAAAFRNVSIAPASSLLYSFGGSFLSVGTESMEDAKNVTGGLPAFKYTAQYNDGKMVNITTEPKLNSGLIVKGQDKKIGVKYDFFKPNAFKSRPSEQLKTIGLKSFSIRGTTYKQTSSTSETSTQIVTTTTTVQFPKQPDAVWDALLEEMYPDLAAVFQSEFNNAALLPVETVTGTEAYKSLTPFAKDDQNTTVEFSRSFRDTRVISAFLPVTEGYGAGSADSKILDQSGADGLLTMTLDLEVSSTKEKHVIMIPKLAFEIVGKTNGYIYDTKFCSGSLQFESGIPISNNVDQAELVKIIRKSSMLSILKKGLQELLEKEKANGDYGPVWALQQ